MMLYAAFLVAIAATLCDGQQKNTCCVNKPPALQRVEIVGYNAQYHIGSEIENYNEDCGLWGWSRCGRSRWRTFVVSQPVAAYGLRQYDQPCAAYACCEGYVMVNNECISLHELPGKITSGEIVG